MGQEVHQDWAIPLDMMYALLDYLNKEWIGAEDHDTKLLVASIGAYSIIAFCGAFRGPEVFLVDLHGLCKFLLDWEHLNKHECVIVPLLGRFKGETGENIISPPWPPLHHQG
jgi:hypothetical protein